MSRIVARGRFRVDRRKALKKMERFQLEDPLRYVLEWVAAAVVAGAEAIDIRNDSDDFELAWEGTELSRDDLDALFDHLFGRPQGRHEAVLQHLGVGVLGALARSPRWLYVDAGPWRLSVTDPADCAAEPLDEPVEGVRCHVRDGLTQETVMEALLLAFRDPAEARLVQGAARWCPVPLRINGTALPPPPEPPDALLALSHPDARLWVVPDEEGHGVDVVRHGIVVHELAVPLAPCRVVGWVRADGVRLNASRSAVVDSDLEGVEALLQEHLDHLLTEQLPMAWGDDRAPMVRWGGGLGSSRPRRQATRGELLDALGRHALVRAGQQPGALAGLPVLTDLAGQAWSIEQLAHHDVGWADEVELLPFAQGRVVFSGLVAASLVSLRGVRDLTEELQVARKVAERRARLADEAELPWAFGGVKLSSTAQHGAWRVGLAFDAWRKSGLRVQLRTDGRLLGEATRDGPGAALVAVVDGPFELGGTDATVQHDAAFDEAMAAVDAEAWRLVATVVAQGRDHSVEALVAVLRSWLEGVGELEGVKALPEGLAQVPAWHVAGELVSTERLFAGVPPAFVVSKLPAGCPSDLAAQALVVPASVVHRVGGWLGSEHVGDEHLARAVRVHHVLHGPKREPRLVPPPDLHVALSYKGLVGELGCPGRRRRVVDRTRHRAPSRQGSVATVLVRVLWKGVSVGQVSLTGPRGAEGIVQGDELPLDVELGLTDAAVAQVRQWGDRALRDLMLQVWDEVPEGEPLGVDLMEWLLRAGGTIPEPEQHRPVLYRVSGEALTLRDLRRLDRRRKGQRKLVVLSHPPGDVGGFDEAVVASGRGRELLELLSQRGWRDGDRDLKEARDLHERFVRRPAYQAPDDPLFEETSESGGLKLAFYLPRDPTHCGRLHVVALHAERPLATRSSTTAPGLLLVVRGLTPNRRCTDVDDSKRLTALKEEAEDRLEAVVESLLKRGVAEVDRASLRALATRLKVAGERERRWRKLARTLGRQPLVQTLGGAWWSPADIAARAASRKPVARVARSVGDGPTDHDGYLRDDEGVAELLRAWLDREVPDRTRALTTWREGQRRRHEAAKVKPRRHGRHVRPIDSDTLQGFLSLRDGSGGLRIDPICEGVDLDDFEVAFPVAAIASVTGVGVRAAPGWRGVVDPDGLAEEVRQAVSVTLDGWVHQRSLPESVALAWVMARGPDAPSGNAPVLPMQSGERCSLRSLVARGGGPVVSEARPLLPGDVGAVVAQGSLRRALRKHVHLKDYDGLQALMRSPPRRLVPEDAPARQWLRGGALWPVLRDDATVDVVQGDVVVAQVRGPAGLRLEGSVDDLDVQPVPTGRGLAPGPALDSLHQRLSGWSRSLAEQLVQRLPHDERARQLLLVGAEDLVRDRRAFEQGRDHPALLAPVVRDSEGAWGSLADVVAHRPIRWVPYGVEGAPDEGRVWRLEATTRDALARRHQVVDYADRLASEVARRRRKARMRVVLPVPPADAAVDREGPFRYALWGHATPADEIMVVVDGSRVDELSLGAGGITGFVEGPFDTDDDFTRARVPKGVRKAMSKAATGLLQREWREAPEAFVARAVAWRGVHGSLRDGALGWVEVARDGRDRPVSLRRLLDRRTAWAWSPRADGSKDTLVGPPSVRTLLEQLTEAVFEAPARPRPPPVDLAPTARRLLDGGGKGLDDALAEVPAALLDAAGRSEAGRVLAAWWVAGRSRDDVDEVALVSRVADELLAALHRSG